MSPVIIGIILIFLGLCLLPISYIELKDELKSFNEGQSIFKRLLVYIVEFIGLLDFDSYLGWLLSLALLLIFSGGAFIILTIL